MARKNLDKARTSFEALTRPTPAAIPPAIARALQERGRETETQAHIVEKENATHD